MSPPPAPPPTGNPRNDLIPRGALFGNPERENVSASPDGKYLSWLAPSDGVLNVWVAPAYKLVTTPSILGRAFIRAAQGKAPKRILESADIHALGSAA